MIKNLANGSVVDNGDGIIKLDGFEIAIELSDEMKNSESERIQKRIEFLKKEIARAEGMLSNERFISKAPEAKVAEEKDKLQKFKDELSSLQGGN